MTGRISPKERARGISGPTQKTCSHRLCRSRGGGGAHGLPLVRGSLARTGSLPPLEQVKDLFVYICVCVRVCLCMLVYVSVFFCMFVYVYVWLVGGLGGWFGMFVYVCVCLCVFLYVCVVFCMVLYGSVWFCVCVRVPSLPLHAGRI